MKLAVFYHCWLPDNEAINLFCEQAYALHASGLSDAAQVFVGLNGDPIMETVIRQVVQRAEVIAHGDNNRGEGATIQALQSWLPSHPDYLVCYHHIKGVVHSPDDGYARWRRCLERHVIWNWKRCVDDLERNGLDTVGAHWHTPHPTQRYWAGTFWWAKAQYLMQLPAIDTKTVSGRCYEAEVWIGKSPNRIIKIRDYANHPLMTGC